MLKLRSMKKGMILVELLVSLVVSSIVLGMLMGSFKFFKNVNDDSLNSARVTYSVDMIKEYILENSFISEPILEKNEDSGENEITGYKNYLRTYKIVLNQDNYYNLCVDKSYLINNDGLTLDDNDTDETDETIVIGYLPFEACGLSYYSYDNDNSKKSYIFDSTKTDDQLIDSINKVYNCGNFIYCVLTYDDSNISFIIN